MSVTQPSREHGCTYRQLLSTGGQNPTVKIRWGDEDRGAAVTPSNAWDNEVTVSTNQAVGSFSTTITIPNLEKVYYFRAMASNCGGTVVSRRSEFLYPPHPWVLLICKVAGASTEEMPTIPLEKPGMAPPKSCFLPLKYPI